MNGNEVIGEVYRVLKIMKQTNEELSEGHPLREDYYAGYAAAISHMYRFLSNIEAGHYNLTRAKERGW